jgi:hypothetical protein
LVVGVGRVEERDQHARVEDGQRHSWRSSSSAPAGQTPGRAPATRSSARRRRSLLLALDVASTSDPMRGTDNEVIVASLAYRCA